MKHLLFIWGYFLSRGEADSPRTGREENKILGIKRCQPGSCVTLGRLLDLSEHVSVIYRTKRTVAVP